VKKGSKGVDARAFGKRLRAARVWRKLSQEKLGEMAGGMAQAYLAQLEAGVRSPSFKTIYRLAIALKMKPATLMEEVRNGQ